MKVRSLSIVRMPGFEQEGFALTDLGEGLNVVVGPNGSGKTTCCRAIRGLLWPGTLAGLSPVSLVGQWEDGDRRLRLEVEGGRFSCQQDGGPGEPPELPGPHLASCFTITIDDLFDHGGTEADLAARIAREMSGGFDLNAVRQSPRLKPGRNHGRPELAKLKDALQQAEAIRAAHEALHREEQELEGLQDRERAARQAQVMLDRLADVRELIAARGDLAAAEAALHAFPDGMALLRGNEGETFRQIETDLRDCADLLAKALDAAEQARRAKAQAALPEEGIDELRLEEQKAHRAALNEAERDLRAVEQRLREAEADRAAAAAAVSDAVPPDRLEAIDTAALNAIEAFHREAEDMQSRRAALRGRLDSLGEGGPAADADSLIRGIGILRQWLEGAAGPAATRRPLALALAMAGILALTGLALAALVHPGWAALLLPALAGAALAAAMLLRPPPAMGPRDALEAHYRRLPLPAPEAWDTAAVGTLLNSLEQEHAKARQAEERRIQSQDCQRQLAELDVGAAALAARREELIATLGVAPDTSTLALVSLAANLQACRQASAARTRLLGEKQTLQAQRDQALRKINGFLQEFGAGPCEAHTVAEVRGRDVEKRAQSHVRAAAALAEAQSAAQAARKRIATLEDRRRGLFQAAGLPEGVAAALHERLDLLADYRKAQATHHELKLKADGLAARLRDVPDLAELTPEQVERRAGELADLADSYKPLVERIAGIRTRVDEARKNTSLEVAAGEVDWARGLLARRREEGELAAAGNWLLDQVEGEHGEQSRPHVFREADRLLALFTRGRYELRIGQAAAQGEPAFRAYDTAARRGLALGELSRGTCMQLLLAVRLAFATAAERGARLPFILDEVLSSSDPTRFRAVTECLLTLVKDGRQVFYFTCQPGDAAAWHEVADQVGAAGARRIDLADVRGLPRAASTLLTASSARGKAIARPEGRSLAEYAAAVGVPPPDLTSGAGTAHPAHLLDDADQLHRLLEAGITTFGQLAALAELGQADAYLPADAWRRARGRAAVLDAFAEGWRIGRGRPLTPEALADAGLSQTFQQRVVDLARDLGWDAAKLIAALGDRGDERAKGFRAAALEQLTEVLTEAGHLDPRPMLEVEELRARVLAAAAEPIRHGDLDPAETSRLFDWLRQLGNAG